MRPGGRHRARRGRRSAELSKNTHAIRIAMRNPTKGRTPHRASIVRIPYRFRARRNDDSSKTPGKSAGKNLDPGGIHVTPFARPRIRRRRAVTDVSPIGERPASRARPGDDILRAVAVDIFASDRKSRPDDAGRMPPRRVAPREPPPGASFRAPTAPPVKDWGPRIRRSAAGTACRPRACRIILRPGAGLLSCAAGQANEESPELSRWLRGVHGCQIR